MTATIELAKSVNDDLFAAVHRLLPQLSSAAPPSIEELQAIVDDPDTGLFVAKLDGVVVGMLTLVLFRIPTGVKAWIEDVVVDGAARGHGLGDALNRAALAHARAHGATAVSLTSRPSREAANRLYQRIGFTVRDTNVYRYSFDT
ncbi:MAG: GNAT family N-acetyltransferase [Ilumatobacteraceae bacterium]